MILYQPDYTVMGGERPHDIFRPVVGYQGRFSVSPGRWSEHLVLASTNKMTYPGRFEGLHRQLVYTKVGANLSYFRISIG